MQHEVHLILHSKRAFRKAYRSVLSQCFSQFVWRRKVDAQWLTLLPSTVIPLESGCKVSSFQKIPSNWTLSLSFLFSWELQKAELLIFFQNIFLILYLAKENTLGVFFSYSSVVANQEIGYLQDEE